MSVFCLLTVYMTHGFTVKAFCGRGYEQVVKKKNQKRTDRYFTLELFCNFANC
jgi:hypothetical protein